MKVTISLEKVPLSIQIEGSDEAMADLGPIMEEAFNKMKKVWFDHLKRQTKLMEEIKSEIRDR